MTVSKVKLKTEAEGGSGFAQSKRGVSYTDSRGEDPKHLEDSKEGL